MQADTIKFFLGIFQLYLIFKSTPIGGLDKLKNLFVALKLQAVLVFRGLIGTHGRGVVSHGHDGDVEVDPQHVADHGGREDQNCYQNTYDHNK
jgi:hypothetical protein